MPIGVIVNVLCVALGGAAGMLFGRHLKEELKDALNMVFGLCAIGMGITSTVLMANLPAAVFSVIAGTAIGITIRLGHGIRSGIGRVVRMLPGASADSERLETLITVTVLFCASGTGIYGTLVSGMSGDHSILIAKAILDLFTAMIFGCSLGAVVSLIAVPQTVIYMALFALAKVILPLCSATMIADLKAVGGLLLLATGLRMLKLKDFPVADMIPAMVLAMPVSWVWTSFIMPLLS